MKIPAPEQELGSLSHQDNNVDGEQPIDAAPEMGGEQPSPAPEMPFGNEKFDAGVEADEATDPKKFIEQLSGKLAQSLRKYNETNQDADLNKFAANTVISASVPKMSSEDAQDVIKKVQDNIGKEQSDGGEPNLEQPAPSPEPAPEQPAETQPQPQQTQEPEQQMPPKMESKVIKSSKKVVKESETMDSLIDKYLNGEGDDTQNVIQKPKSKIFKTPEFK